MRLSLCLVSLSVEVTVLDTMCVCVCVAFFRHFSCLNSTDEQPLLFMFFTLKVSICLSNISKYSLVNKIGPHIDEITCLMTLI